MRAPTSTTEQYRSQQERAAVANLEAQRLWSGLGDDWDRSWLRIGPQLVTLVTAAQFAAASSAVEYVPAVLEETGQQLDAEWETVPEAFAGAASDGRPLDSLLYQAVVKSAESYNGGTTTRNALHVGAQFLTLAVTALVQDAGRAATGVGAASNPFVHGYVRFLNPPSCKRCAVLAGREYRYSTGFLRHPRCDCVMVPAKNAQWASAEGLIWDPTANLDKIKDLTVAERSAIASGADISQVVNARRGMSVGGLTTLEGTTARGAFGRAEIAAGSTIARGSTRPQGAVRAFRQSSTTTVRLTPERIYQVARTDAEAIALLERYGYIRPRRP